MNATRHRITVENPDGLSRGVQLIEVDGRPLQGREVPLFSDCIDHTIRVVLG
ncbi:MAG: hypothetical protein H0W53_10820 [Acidobacteria bacterium]|nr:hypothetical protein [Acidobacteriota bacterium]